MIPRFTNPNNLVDATVHVSRKEIFPEPTDALEQVDGHLLHHLMTVVQESLGTIPQKRKRENDLDLLMQDDTGLEPFRLLSAQPMVITLSQKLPPANLLITREPASEDTKAQASVRKRRARAVAVDGNIFQHLPMQMLTRIKQSSKSRQRDAIHIRAPIHHPPPPTLVLEHKKRIYTTRPPVASSLLSHYPYKKDGLVLPLPSFTKCTRLDIDFDQETEDHVRVNKRRRRKKNVREPRPPPAFWRPNPRAGGKGLGYAMGYPISCAALKTGASAIPYKRDKMKKARYSEIAESE